MKIDLIIHYNNITYNITELELMPDLAILKNSTDKTDIIRKAFFRGIAKNIPWINNIFLVVSDISILPTWLDLSKFKIIQYQDFIPAEYLEFATNTNTVELFYYLIPELSEYFITMHNDTFLLSPLTQADFFDLTTNKPIISMTPMHVLGMATEKENPEDAIFLAQYQKFIDDNAKTCIKAPVKTLIPFTKTLYKKVFEEYKTELINSLTTEISSTNFNQYFICYYGLANNLVLDIPGHLNIGNFFITTVHAGIIKYDLLNNPDRKVMFINNIGKLNLETFHPRALDWLIEGLTYRIPQEKCKFEL